MASTATTLAPRRLPALVPRALRAVPRPRPGAAAALAARHMHATRPRATDGVFRGLTDDRLPTPWIEAFRAQQAAKDETAAEGGGDNGGGADKARDSAGEERDLSPKRMSDSYHRVVLPLGRDPWLSDTYINASGHIRYGGGERERDGDRQIAPSPAHNGPPSHAPLPRLGTILMDLDALSGIVVYKHTGPGVTTVTAALDRVTISRPLTEVCDLEYSGQVTYATGRSSVEITCRVSRARGDDEPSRPEDVLLTCTFTMVALDPATRRPTNVPPLECTTDEERAIFKRGEAKSLAKKRHAKTSLLATEPDDPESALIHKIWLRQVAYHDPNNPLRQPAEVIPMASTRLADASIMQPQYRNRHQTMIFGGFHLKQTFELAFCCAASFAHARPTFISADPCTFPNPVPVGSVLYLSATVVYTDPPLLEEDGSAPAHADPDRPVTRVHVRVDSKVRDVEHGNARPTGQFNYTFSVPRNVKIIPHTYQEFMMYVDARRRVKLGDDQRRRDEGGAAQEKSISRDNILG
jgi:acyl-coenzyme A thioesterase 9